MDILYFDLKISKFCCEKKQVTHTDSTKPWSLTSINRESL